MPTNIRDPRTIITPDAFGISEDLLGTPLAAPWRRFWAMMIDLVAIGVLTALFDSIQLLIWGVVGLFLIRIAFQRTRGPAEAVAVLMRVSAGCLGLTVLFTVLVVFFLFSGDDDEEPGRSGAEAAAGILRDLGEDLGPLAAGFTSLRAADTDEEAVEAAVQVLRTIEETSGRTPDDPVEILEELAPEDAPWEERADSIYAVAVDRWREGPGRDGEDPGDPGAAGPDPDGPDETVAEGQGRDALPATAEEVAALSDSAALATWVAAAREGGPVGAEDGAVDPVVEALRRRVGMILAADTVERLEEAVDDARDEREDAEDELADLREELAAEQSSFVALLRDIWDQAGSAIGLWSLYFTVLLTLWKGQTLGKKALGLRVQRLDGEAMTWWTSFERAGGYVAGIATGLLGFAQVFWDPNRQCIHDKIVGTVVVRSGVPKVPGAWQEARGVDGIRQRGETAERGGRP